MITATFKKNKPGFITSYEISGHAEYAPAGQDIVCAAVSALFTTITNEMIDCVIINKNEDSHFVRVHHCNDKTRNLTDTLLAGFLDISRAYPENVKVNVIT